MRYYSTLWNTFFMILIPLGIHCKEDRSCCFSKWCQLQMLACTTAGAGPCLRITTQVSYHFSLFTNCYFITRTEQSVLTVSVHQLSPKCLFFSKNVEIQTEFLEVFAAHFSHWNYSQMNITMLEARTGQVTAYN